MQQGLNAIVTGSSSGIGLGIARVLAQQGMNVMMNGIEDDRQIESERAGIEAETRTKIRYKQADMTKPAEIRELVEHAVNAFGRVDVLVNNAGIQFVSPIDEFPEDKWNSIIQINLNAAFHGVKAVLPGMKSRGFGRIINIASVHGLVASPYKSAYVAAKHGIIGLTKSVALEVAEHGITVNAICPGYVWTSIMKKQVSDMSTARGVPEKEVEENMLSVKHATRKFVTVEQVAHLVCFLCRVEAGSITGSAMPVDGGWTAA